MRLAMHNTVGKVPGPHLGRGWTNIEAEWDLVFTLITEIGHASTAELKGDSRTSDQFVSRDLFMIDIDKGMTFQELFEDTFYNQYGAGFYTTPSHKDIENPKFRIMFRTEYPITDQEQYKKIYRALLRIYEAADIACKDATRLFFGSVNAEHKEITDKLLGRDIINSLIEIDETFKSGEEINYTTDVTYNPELSDYRKRRIIELLKISFIGDYDKWIRIGFGMKDGGFTIEDFKYVTQGLMKAKTDADATRVWDSKNNTGKKCSIGTVITFLYSRHGKDCLVEKQYIPYNKKYTNTSVKLRKGEF